MEFDVIFPQREIGNDAETIRRFARTAEASGYDQIHAFDHVLGVDRNAHSDFTGPYDYKDAFHEPFSLFSHLAAVTTDIDFVTGVLVLPQRQTSLVAKQAAQVDVLSGGRMKLGVGVGWNDLEYAALGADFNTRGRRIEEQLDVLRALWTEETVDFEGEFHHIPHAGINPLPMQRPIPVYLGGGADVVLRRAAKLADGWIVPSTWKSPESDLSGFAETLETVYGYLEAEGRDPENFTVIGRTSIDPDDPTQWVERARRWNECGVSHLAVTTMGLGFESPEEHISTIQAWKTAMDESDIPLTNE